MKTLYHLLTLVMGLILFVSCDKESEVLQNPEEKILKIQVTDKGYASDPANKETKAIDEEFNTTFENGDKIGVFIVDEDGSITYANVPVTLKDNVWVDETQGVRIKSTTARVFAYYPYVEDSKINDLVSPEAESESDFFAGYINSLDISDQSTLSRYRQADVLGCMVEKGSISEGTITFNMSHLMGLVVLDFSKVVCSSYDLYSLTTDPDYQWKRNIKTSSAIISELKIEDKTLNAESVSYKYLQKPGDNTFNGTFRANGEAKTFTIAFTNLQSGAYKSYHIKGNAADIVNNKTHSLKIGDIFKSDGGLISQEELAEITDDEKAECVGVVFQTDLDRIGEKEKNVLKEGGGNPHGLVLAVKNACINVQWKKSNDDSPIESINTLAEAYKDINGLQNCITIGMNSANYPAFKAAGDYNEQCPISGITTGWFLPSYGQWWDILENLGICDLKSYRESLENQTIIGGSMAISAGQNISNYYVLLGEYQDNIDYSQNKAYWTSSAYTSDKARDVGFSVNTNLYLYCHNKTDSDINVRCVLAF